MNANEFLGLESTHNPNRFVMPVTTGIATAGRFMFGGCGLAAAICALEQRTGRSAIWATSQYLSFAMVDEVIDVDVSLSVEGHFTSQARVLGSVSGREIFTVNAALGERPMEWSGQWVSMPEVPSPEDSIQRASRWDLNDTIMERMDIRLAKGSQWEDLSPDNESDGTSALWVRLPDVEMGAAALAVLGDYVPYGISQALGRLTRSNSLDNTLRICRAEPSEWVLLDIQVHSVQDGFGHGLVHLWSESGALLATASQSSVIHQEK